LQRVCGSDDGRPAERPVRRWLETAEGGDAPDLAELRTLVDQRVFMKWRLGTN